MTETARINKAMAAAIEELKILIRSYDPDAQFEVAAGPDASDTYLIARVDTEDADEVMDLYIDRLVEMQVEDRLPLYVMTLRANNELPNKRASRGSRQKPRV